MNLDLKNRKWVYYGVSAFPVYLLPFLEAPSRIFTKLYGLSCDGVALWRGKNCDWLYDEKQLLDFSVAVMPSLLEKKWGTYDSWYKLAEEFENSHMKLMAQDLSNLSRIDLKKQADEYYGSFLTQYAINNWIEPLSIFFQEKLRDLLAAEGLEPGKVDELIADFSRPARDSYLKICAQELASHPNDAGFLLKKYHYINNDYTGPKTVSETDIRALAATSNLVIEGAIDVGKEDLSQKVKDLLSLLQITATIQDVRKAYSLMWVSGAHILLAKLAISLGCREENLNFGFWDEIWKEGVDLEALKNRSVNFVSYHKKDGREIAVGPEAEKIRSEFERYIVGVNTDLEEIKGVGASGGKVRGRVCNVTNLSHFNKVKPGDILVTVMTRPEYLPLMRLASAFVTDEGGITCHAAIISREMKKPCIIGTKIATRILHDGDEVEVDANKGIVRILSKK